jgi:hypothetical protein
LTFRPDIPPDEWKRSRRKEQPTAIKVEHDHHSWDGYDMYRYAILKLFTSIGNRGQFINDEQEKHWWEQLPLVPAVTGVLLRQQKRRQ